MPARIAELADVADSSIRRTGSIPPLTAAGQDDERPSVRRPARRLSRPMGLRGEPIELDDCCLTLCVVPDRRCWTPGYNSNYQIVQTPGYVMILHRDDRTTLASFPLDGRPQRAGGRPAVGRASRAAGGRATPCVVETTELQRQESVSRVQRAPARHRALHPCRREDTDPGTRFTIDDELDVGRGRGPPSFPSMRTATARSFEHACHEGNYGLLQHARWRTARGKESRRAGWRERGQVMRSVAGAPCLDDKPGHRGLSGSSHNARSEPSLTTAQDLSDRPVTFLNDAGIDGGERREPFVIEEQEANKGDSGSHVR